MIADWEKLGHRQSPNMHTRTARNQERSIATLTSKQRESCAPNYQISADLDSNGQNKPKKRGDLLMMSC